MNSAELHKRALDVFDQICDLSHDERVAFPSEHCREPQLREDVEALLRHDDSTSGFLTGDIPNANLDAMAAEAFGNDGVDMPDRIGQYKIVRKIGEGGMGIIYEALQESPRRRVSLKVLRPGLVGPKMLKRFQHEAHVLGQLQHPGIAHIYEAGVADLRAGSQPYFVMEFIDGLPLDRYITEHAFSLGQKLSLFAQVCDAVQHAHQKGIIHRDLKPGNILVTEQHTHPDNQSNIQTVVDSLGQPKVLDFGIARVTDADIQTVTVQTDVGQLVGTLAYMSPEQVMGVSDNIDTRSDIYTLGVILYKLVTGKLPHDFSGCAIPEAARIIREDDPSLVSAMDSSLRGDIDTIIAKAMEKDPTRRYALASDLAADIRRHEPIIARPASTLYQLGKFARRNKGLVAGLAATMVALTVGLATTGYYLIESQSAKARLESVVQYQSAMLLDIDVEEMGRKIVADLRSEANNTLAGGGEQATAQLASFEQVLSRLNPTTIANRSLDASIMTRAVEALDVEFTDQPDLQAELRSSLVDIYGNIGLSEKSLAQARSELETRRRSFGNEGASTLAVRQKICNLHVELGDYEEAETIARDLLKDQRRVLGDDHIETLITQRILGQVLSKLTKPEAALIELQASLAGLEKAVGGSHTATLATRNELGEYYYQKREMGEAKREFEIVFQERERNLGSKHPNTLETLGRIAGIHFAQKQFEQAAPLFERIYKDLSSTKGEDHPATLTARSNLAINLTALGRYESAEPIVLDTLQRKQRALGTDHPSTVSTLGAALRLMLKLERWDDAESYGLEALAVTQRTLGPDNIKTLTARNDLIWVYNKSERFDKAVAMGRETLDEYRRVLGTDHYRTLGTHLTVGKILMAAGNLEEAAQVFGEALEKTRAQHANKPMHAGLLGKYVTVLINLDRGDEAEPMAQELLDWCVTKKVDEAVIARAHLWVARAQFAQAQYDDADQTLVKAISLMPNNSDDPSWQRPLAQLFRDVIAVRNGASTRSDDASESYQGFRDLSHQMYVEDRKTILPEAQHVLANAGIEL